MKESLKFSFFAGLLVSFFVYTWFIYLQPETMQFPFDEAAGGKVIWQEKNCIACHQIYGLGGFLGPDLSNVYSTSGKGPHYIKAFIRGGTSVMPSYDLSDKELECLIGFLKQVDATGNADPKRIKRHVNGTIELQQIKRF